MERAGLCGDAFLCDRRHPFVGTHHDIQPFKQIGGGRRDVLGQQRQYPRRCLDQREPDVAARVEMFEPVGGMRSGRVPYLRRQFHARGPGTDDGDMQLPGLELTLLRVRTQARIEQSGMKQGRLRRKAGGGFSTA